LKHAPACHHTPVCALAGLQRLAAAVVAGFGPQLAWYEGFTLLWHQCLAFGLALLDALLQLKLLDGRGQEMHMRSGAGVIDAQQWGW